MELEQEEAYQSNANQSQSKKRKYKTKIIKRKGELFRTHPFSIFYSIYPECNTLKEELMKTTTSIKSEASLSDLSRCNVRKYFNDKVFACITRPQYKYSCGISAVVSVWNYLFSHVGFGDLNPITQEQAMEILGFQQPYEKIRFGKIAKNKMLLTWFNKLTEHFEQIGHAYFLWKPRGISKTKDKKVTEVKRDLIGGLQNKRSAFIYHCYNHYSLIVGFDQTPTNPLTAYSDKLSKDDASELWIMIGDTSRTAPPISSIKFETIMMDLHCKSPYGINIRHLEQGILERLEKEKTDSDKELSDSESEDQVEEDQEEQTEAATKKSNVKVTNHCIMAFTSNNI